MDMPLSKGKGEIATTLTVLSLLLLLFGTFVGTRTRQDIRNKAAEQRVCSYTAINEIRDADTGQVLTNMQGVVWKNSFGDTAPFPGVGNLRTTWDTDLFTWKDTHTTFVPIYNEIVARGFIETWVELTSYPSNDYDIVDIFKESCKGQTCSHVTAARSSSGIDKARVDKIRIECGGSITYGWKLKKKTQPTPTVSPTPTLRPTTQPTPTIILRVTLPTPTTTTIGRRPVEEEPQPTPTVRPTSQPTPTRGVSRGYACNMRCTPWQGQPDRFGQSAPSSQCISGFTCVDTCAQGEAGCTPSNRGVCRAISCPSDTTCTCGKPAPTRAPNPTRAPTATSTPNPVCKISTTIRVVDEKGALISTSDFVQPDKWGISNSAQYSLDSSQPAGKFTGSTTLMDYRNVPISFKPQDPNADFTIGEEISIHLFTDDAYKSVGWKVKKCGKHTLDFQCFDDYRADKGDKANIISGIPLDCGMEYEFEFIVARSCTLDSKVTIKDETGKILSRSELLDPSAWGVSNSKQSQDKPAQRFDSESAVVETHVPNVQFAPKGLLRYGEDISMKLFHHPLFEILYRQVPTCQENNGPFLCREGKSGPIRGGDSSLIPGIPITCNAHYELEYFVKKKPAGDLRFKIELSGGGNFSGNVPFNIGDISGTEADLSGTVKLIGLNNEQTFAFNLAPSGGIVDNLFSHIPVGQYRVEYIPTKREIGSVYTNESKHKKWCKNDSGKEILTAKTAPPFVLDPILLNDVGKPISTIFITQNTTSIVRAVINHTDKVVITSYDACKDCGGNSDWKISDKDWAFPRYICKANNYEYNNECNATYQPVEFFNNCRGDRPDSKNKNNGCWCTNRIDCSKAAGTVKVSEGANYCRETNDIICCLGSASPSDEQQNANRCCESNEQCSKFGPTWQCSASAHEAKDCASNKKCINTSAAPEDKSGIAPTPLPASQKIGAEGKISVKPGRFIPMFQTSSTQDIDQEQINFELLSDSIPHFKYEIQIPKLAVVTEFKYVSLTDRNGKDYVIHDNITRTLPIDRPPGWTQTYPKWDQNIDDLIFSEIDVPEGQDIRDFIARGILHYVYFDEVKNTLIEQNTPLIKNWQPKETSQRFLWWLSKTNPPSYLKGIIDLCKSSYESCRSCRDGNCPVQGGIFTNTTCKSLPDECIVRIDGIKQKIATALDEAIVSQAQPITQAFSAFFGQPCINAGLIIMPAGRLATICKTTARAEKSIDAYIDLDKIREQLKEIILSEVNNGNGLTPILELIGYNDITLHPDQVNVEGLKKRIISNDRLIKFLVRKIADNIQMPDLISKLKKFKLIGAVLNIIDTFKNCGISITELPAALKNIGDRLHEKIYESSLSAQFFIANNEENRAINGIDFSVCTSEGCIDKSVDYIVNPGQKEWLDVLWVDLENIQDVKSDNYDVTCKMKYADGSQKPCNNKITLDSSSTPLITIDANQQNISVEKKTDINPDSPISPFKPTDFNNDGATNTLDYSMLLQRYGQQGNLNVDVNSDGFVNSLDMSVVVERIE